MPLRALSCTSTLVLLSSALLISITLPFGNISSLQAYATYVPDESGSIILDMVSSGSHVYVLWKNTDGKHDIFLKRSSDYGRTFDNAINLSNNLDENDFVAKAFLAVHENNAYVVWSGIHSTTTAVACNSNNNDAIAGISDSNGERIGRVYLSKSTDYGSNFAAPVAVSERLENAFLSGVKASENNNYIYLLWIYDSHTGGPHQQLTFRKSTDNAASFNNEIVIADSNKSSLFLDTEMTLAATKLLPLPDANNFTNATATDTTTKRTRPSSSLIDSQDTVFVVWNSNRTIFFTSSLDSGNTFAVPLQIHGILGPEYPHLAAVDDSTSRINSNTNTTTTTTSVVALVSNTSNQKVYITWWDQYSTGTPGDIFIGKSSDGGKIFSNSTINVSRSSNLSNYVAGRNFRVVSVFPYSYVKAYSGSHVLVAWQINPTIYDGNYSMLITQSDNYGNSFDKPQSITDNTDYIAGTENSLSKQIVITLPTIKNNDYNSFNDNNDKNQTNIVYAAWPVGKHTGADSGSIYFNGTFDIFFRAGTIISALENNNTSNADDKSSTRSAIRFESKPIDLSNNITRADDYISPCCSPLSAAEIAQPIVSLPVDSPNHVYVAWGNTKLGSHNLFFRASDNYGKDFGGLVMFDSANYNNNATAMPSKEQLQKCQELGIPLNGCNDIAILQKQSYQYPHQLPISNEDRKRMDDQQNQINNSMYMIGIGAAIAGIVAFVTLRRRK